MSDKHILYQKRLKRVMDASKLIEPDQVPIVPVFQSFPVNYAGSNVADAMKDADYAAKAYDRFYADFQPDLGWDLTLMSPSDYLEQSGITWFRWPGKHLDPHEMYQYIEGEYMLPDEYPEAISDPTKFMLNKWLPRSFSNFQGLKKLDFRDSMWFGHMGTLLAFSDAEVINTLETMVSTGRILAGWFEKIAEYRKRMKDEFGIPPLYAGFAFAPFDKIGDSMRGTTGVLMDLYDHPEELLELTDIVTEFSIKNTIAGCKGAEVPFVWYWLHKGIDDFMSDAQFGKFYWPSLKRYAEAVIDAGLTPVFYVEGAYNTRLEYLKELPPKKVIFSFEYTDMAKAKEVLGGHSCIMGNVPSFLLSYGKPDEVADYCKWLIDTCAPGGGYIMDSATMIDDAKPECIEAMFEATYRYGKK